MNPTLLNRSKILWSLAYNLYGDERLAPSRYIDSSPTSCLRRELSRDDKLSAPMYNSILDIHAPLEFTDSLSK